MACSGLFGAAAQAANPVVGRTGRDQAADRRAAALRIGGPAGRAGIAQGRCHGPCAPASASRPAGRGIPRCWWKAKRVAPLYHPHYREDNAVALRTNYPVVADPEDQEINRLQLTNISLTGYHHRARPAALVLDDQRFIGNVAWRMNEQTFDALRVTNRHINNLVDRCGLDRAREPHLRAGFAAESVGRRQLLRQHRLPDQDRQDHRLQRTCWDSGRSGRFRRRWIRRARPLRPTACVSPANARPAR